MKKVVYKPLRKVGCIILSILPGSTSCTATSILHWPAVKEILQGCAVRDQSHRFALPVDLAVVDSVHPVLETVDNCLGGCMCYADLVYILALMQKSLAKEYVD